MDTHDPKTGKMTIGGHQARDGVLRLPNEGMKITAIYPLVEVEAEVGMKPATKDLPAQPLITVKAIVRLTDAMMASPDGHFEPILHTEEGRAEIAKAIAGFQVQLHTETRNALQAAIKQRTVMDEIRENLADMMERPE